MSQLSSQTSKFGWVKSVLYKNQTIPKRHFITFDSKLTVCGLEIEIDESSGMTNNVAENAKCNNCVKAILSRSDLPSHWKSKSRLIPKIIKHSPNYKKSNSKPKSLPKYKQVDAICSYPACPETGITYIREDKDVTTNSHFCIKHNPKILGGNS